MELQRVMTSTAECRLSRSWLTCISIVLFLHTLPVACVWQSGLEEHGPAVVAGLVPCTLCQAGGHQGATLDFSSSGPRSVSLMLLCPLQSSKCQDLANTWCSEQF